VRNVLCARFTSRLILFLDSPSTVLTSRCKNKITLDKSVYYNIVFYYVISSRSYSVAVVAINAFEVEIEVHAGWGNTDKVAEDSPINKQQKQGKRQ
jgi:hypothetical protein